MIILEKMNFGKMIKKKLNQAKEEHEEIMAMDQSEQERDFRDFMDME